MIIAIELLLLILILYIFSRIQKEKNDTKTLTILNDGLRDENKRLETENNIIKEKTEQYLRQNETLTQEINENINKLAESARTLKENEDTLDQVLDNYKLILEEQYQKTEQEYDEHLERLFQHYDDMQEKELKELEKIRSTRQAAIQAALKEKEIQEQSTFYSLTLNDNDQSDILVLERVKPNLFAPRVLSMLIWQTYFRENMTLLCNRVLGTETVTGIYKITNILTQECYIGQAVDVAKRWKDHAKAGLDIDRPMGNKLYQAMIVDGLWNFSWELLEQCPREDLDEKEKFYIDLYQSREFGYNGNKRQ